MQHAKSSDFTHDDPTHVTLENGECRLVGTSSVLTQKHLREYKQLEAEPNVHETRMVHLLAPVAYLGLFHRQPIQSLHSETVSQ
jgi:hypothetical protein